MPPKAKKVDKAQKKAIDKQKSKIIEDKTFGLKNKNKSKQVQKYVQDVEKQVNDRAQKLKGFDKEFEERKKEKKEKQAFEQQLNVMFRPMGVVGAAAKKKSAAKAGLDSSKTIIMAAEGKNKFVAGEVVEEERKVRVQETYEVFEEEKDVIEDELEKERQALPEGGTPVTLETFMAWKEKKRKELEKATAEQKQKEEQAAKRGKGASGRALFALRSDLFVDDADAADDYEREKDDAEVYDVQVSATGIKLTKLEEGEEGGSGSAAAGASELDVPVQESLFLDDDIELPDDLE